MKMADALFSGIEAERKKGSKFVVMGPMRNFAFPVLHGFPTKKAADNYELKPLEKLVDIRGPKLKLIRVNAGRVA